MTESSQGKRAANKEARRRALLDAARRLYAEHGVENTRMEDVAVLAGCTRRTLYAYFDSWEDLCVQVLIEDTEVCWEERSRAMARATSGLEKLRAYGRAYWEYSKRNLPSLALLIFLDYHRFDIETHRPEVLDRFRTVVDPVVSSMREVMELARAEGDVRPDIDIDSALAHYAYSLRAVMYRALTPGTSFFEIQPDDFVHAYIEHFLRGLGPDAATRS